MPLVERVDRSTPGIAARRRSRDAMAASSARRPSTARRIAVPAPAVGTTTACASIIVETREQRRESGQRRPERPAAEAGFPPHQRPDDDQAHHHGARQRAERRRRRCGRPVHSRAPGRPGADAGEAGVHAGRGRSPAVQREMLRVEHRLRHTFAPRRKLEPDAGKHHEDESDPSGMYTTERHSAISVSTRGHSSTTTRCGQRGTGGEPGPFHSATRHPRPAQGRGNPFISAAAGRPRPSRPPPLRASGERGTR